MRAITFPKTGDGVWTNRETGVRVSKRYEGYYRILAGGLPKDPAVGVHCQYNTWTQALAAAKNYVATTARPAIAEAYVEAVAEHVERAAAAATDAGAASWRVDAARRAVTYAQDAESGFWLASAIYEVRRIEEACEASIVATAPTDADAIHFDHSFGEPIACGATGRVRVTSRRMDVTCEGCESALDARDFDRTRAALITDHGQAAHDHPDMPRAARLRGTREGVEMLHEISADLDVAERRCTKADGWLQSHPFEYNPNAVEAAKAGNGGYDEYERCGERRDHARHQMPSAAAEPGPDEPISYWPADMLREGDMVAAPNSSTGHTVTETYGSVRPWVALTDTNDRGTAIPASDVVSQWTRVESPGDYMWAADVIHSAKRPEGPGHPRGCTCGECEVRRNGVWRAYGPTGERPAAPDDVNDDEAWAAYCAMLPSPTDEQVAAVAAEYTSPYAEQVQQCVDAFRSTARLLWSLRREGQLTNDRCSTLRHSMRVLRDCIETYRGLAAGARNGVQR